jgi:two-component system, NarL family, sensor kinase
MTSPPARSRFRGVLAIALFAVAMAETVTTIVVITAGQIPFTTVVNGFIVTNGAMGLAFPVCGILLAWHRPRNPVGWLFLASGLGMATSAAAAALAELGAVSGWSPGALRALGTVVTYAWPWTIALFLPVALLLFPDGHPIGPRWRWPIRAAVVNSVVFVASLGSPDPLTIGSRRITIYLAIPHYQRFGPLWAVTNVTWAVILAAAIASLAVRYRRSNDIGRRQLLWLLLAGLVVLPYAGVVWGVFNSGPILGLLVLPTIPAAVTVAILRYQLLDIRVVISRTLTYAIVTGLLVGLYAGLVLLTTQVFRIHTPVAVAASTLVAAALFNRLRRRVQRAVDRRFNRARYNAEQTVAAFAARLKDATDLDTVHDDLASVVTKTLEPAYVSVWIRSEERR